MFFQEKQANLVYRLRIRSTARIRFLLYLIHNLILNPVWNRLRLIDVDSI